MTLKPKDLTVQTIPELEAKLLDLRAELSKEKSLIASGTRAEKPAKIKELRRDIARILTIINQKKTLEVTNK